MTKSRGILPPRRAWTAEEVQLLRALFPGMRTAEVAARIGRTYTAVAGYALKLGLRKSAAFLSSEASGRMLRGDNRGERTRYAKGCSPMNKGLRRPGYSVGRGRMQETQFKKGERRGVAVDLYQPIGTERISKDGYRERKVNDDLPLQRRWRAVHRIMWEAVHGPIPSKHVVAFINGDKTDLRIENLTCLSQQEWMRRNTVHNLPAPLPQTIQLLGALRRRLNRRTREEQDRRPA